MADEPFRIVKGQRSPSMADTIKISGVAQDLTGATVKLMMRALRDSTELVDTAATIVSAVAGTVRYDWATADTNRDAGTYMGWWRVTWSNGTTQDSLEFPIEILEHADHAGSLCSVADVRRFLQSPTIATARDDLIEDVIVRSSAAIERFTEREFLPSAADTARTFEGLAGYGLYIGDLSAVPTADVTVADSDGTARGTLAPGVIEWLPLNRREAWRPITKIRLRPKANFCPLPTDRVTITGTWGFPAIPDDVRHAAIVTASSWLQREVAGVASLTDDARGDVGFSGGLGGMGIPAGIRRRLEHYRGIPA